MNNEDKVISFGKMLLKYLPQLRGITAYPDGARGGQPMTAVSYKTAIKKKQDEKVFEQFDQCSLTGAGSCSA